MKKPSDITQEIWNKLPIKLQYSLSRNANRSFIHHEIENNYKKIKSGLALNHKVNTSLNQLRALVISAVKMDLPEEILEGMVQSQELMMSRMLDVDAEINEANDQLKDFLKFIDDRIEYYKGVL